MIDLPELHLDLGDIRGNFPCNYSARIVPFADTPILRAIEKSTGVRREKSLALEIATDTGSRTVGLTCEDSDSELTPCVFTTPNPRLVGVRLQGCTYMVNVDTGAAQRLSVTPLMVAASDTLRGVMYLADNIRVAAFTGTELVWMSERVALDGIRRLTHDNGTLHGLADVGGDKIVAFTIDTNTGRVRGGFPEWFPDWPGSV